MSAMVRMVWTDEATDAKERYALRSACKTKGVPAHTYIYICVFHCTKWMRQLSSPIFLYAMAFCPKHFISLCIHKWKLKIRNLEPYYIAVHLALIDGTRPHGCQTNQQHCAACSINCKFFTFYCIRILNMNHFLPAITCNILLIATLEKFTNFYESTQIEQNTKFNWTQKSRGQLNVRVEVSASNSTISLLNSMNLCHVI